MATVAAPTTPTPDETPEALLQSVLALKQSMEIQQGTRRAKVNTSPTLVQTQIGAAIRLAT